MDFIFAVILVLLEWDLPLIEDFKGSYTKILQIFLDLSLFL